MNFKKENGKHLPMNENIGKIYAENTKRIMILKMLYKLDRFLSRRFVCFLWHTPRKKHIINDRKRRERNCSHKAVIFSNFADHL